MLVITPGERLLRRLASASRGEEAGEGSFSLPTPEKEAARNRSPGNVIVGIGSVLYGLYGVRYKKLACPPEGTSPERGMIFDNLFGSLIESFTIFVLWIPLPLLHIMGREKFE